MNADTPTAEQVAQAQRGRQIFWTLVALWGIVAYFAGDWLAQDMRFRVNDLAAISGAGYIARDAEGIYYHINNRSKARAIYPELREPVYDYDCFDCKRVNSDQLTQINQFCATAQKDTLPQLDFEVPCSTWAPQHDLTKFLSFAIFLVPLMLWPIVRFLLSPDKKLIIDPKENQFQ
ncbi:MAG: hypothetical protein Q8L99_03220 [Polycyclovorans sp.]|jgi:hypothetical protein|nr:hypothetical protein [Polycyclovorans sp.]MBU0790222.1 hypothetical protein [Gammaproteobacteria bacterium]MDP1542145.1 hypothetical protein [Polycyclovorans sp.]MEC8848576.1 hypothetical protein [Pseudomonadota bacterium]|tara:strand:+ start:5150 stop:5677 length:528 start_codon:yes stop_codon:yes gene_type:complete